MGAVYKPAVELFTSGGPFTMVTVKDGDRVVDLFLEQREARELAAAIEHTTDMAASGTEYSVNVAISA